MLFFFYRITNSIKRASKLCRCFFNTERMAQKRLIYHVFEPFPSPPKPRAEGSSPSAPATSDLQEWLRQAVFEGFSFSTNELYPVTSNKYLTNWCLHLTLSRYYPTFLQSPFWKFCRCGRKILASCCYCYAPTNQLPAPL